VQVYPEMDSACVGMITPARALCPGQATGGEEEALIRDSAGLGAEVWVDV